jgi:hypothetical protein
MPLCGSDLLLPLERLMTKQQLLPYGFSLLSGAICLPATFSFTRHGSLMLSAVIVLAIAGAVIPFRLERKVLARTRWWWSACAFACGAFLAEAVSVASYLMNTGSSDPKLEVEVMLSVLELIVISLIGCVAVYGIHLAIMFFSGNEPSSPEDR